MSTSAPPRLELTTAFLVAQGIALDVEILPHDQILHCSTDNNHEGMTSTGGALKRTSAHFQRLQGVLHAEAVLAYVAARRSGFRIANCNTKSRPVSLAISEK